MKKSSTKKSSTSKSAAKKSSAKKTSAKKKSAVKKKPAAKKPSPGRAVTKPLDLYAEHASEYVAPREPVLIEIGSARYLAITGRGEPGGAAFTEAVGALYNVAFTVKMTRKFAGTLYTVSKLEALWWGSGPNQDFLHEPRDQWNWQLLIRTPEFITGTDLGDAVSTLIGRRKPERVRDVELIGLDEGSCIQMLHLGPYAEEWRSVELMNALARREGRQMHGRHHEIYLSDPRRVDPSRLRTILRMPVR